MAVKAQFLGPAYGEPDHEFLGEVPARDLTDEDWARLSDAQRTDVRAVKHSRTGAPLYLVRDDVEAPAEAQPMEPAAAEAPEASQA